MGSWLLTSFVMNHQEEQGYCQRIIKSYAPGLGFSLTLAYGQPDVMIIELFFNFFNHFLNRQRENLAKV